jgi:hypothetical protein
MNINAGDHEKLLLKEEVFSNGSWLSSVCKASAGKPTVSPTADRELACWHSCLFVSIRG